MEVDTDRCTEVGEKRRKMSYPKKLQEIGDLFEGTSEEDFFSIKIILYYFIVRIQCYHPR